MATVDKSYIYSIGRVKELEKGLLTEPHLDRVIESDDPLSVLRSLGFFKTGDDHEQLESFHHVFLQERQYNRKQLHELVADSPLEDIFLLPYDIENIKVLLKGKLTENEAIKDMSIEGGKFQKPELLEAVYGSLPTRISPAILDEIPSIAEEFQTSKRFALVDYRFERQLRKLQLDIARRAKSDFMVAYLQHLCDIRNISTTIRQKLHRLGRESLASALLDTGILDRIFFERIYDGGWESLAAAFKPTAYGKMVEQVVAEVNQEMFLPFLDVACANLMIAFLQTSKHLCFGIEPILAFYLAREHELKIVRMILVGKEFDYPREKLQQRIRGLYS